MKKHYAILLSICIGAFALTASGAETGYDPDCLHVGNPTRLTGDFFTDLWGNATSDLDVRRLLHSYSLISREAQTGAYIFNPTVVNGKYVQADAEGNHYYRISLYPDLQYSDGSPIKAADYVFSILLEASPQLAALGADTKGSSFLTGYEAYARSETPCLKGVRLDSEYEFSIEISHDALPYYYEMTLLDYSPYPISEIAPGCEVKDDGEGAYIAGSSEQLEGSALSSVFTTDLLEKTIADPQTGYRTHPVVTSGPYCLDSFDGLTASFTLNEYFKGDEDGNKPLIAHLDYSLADNAGMASDLQDGRFDLINKAANKDAAADLQALVREDDRFTSTTYPRQGLSFIAFCGDNPAVQDLAVRRAFAWCLDRNAIAEGYVGTLGTPVTSYYGIGQWMYQMVNGTSSASDAAWDALSLDGIETYSLESREAEIAAAASELEAAGWVLGEDGEENEEGSNPVRCREINGESMPLELTLGYPEGSAIGALLEEYLAKPLSEAGIALMLEPVPMQSLLEEYYYGGETDLLFLATNFDEVFDPAGQLGTGAQADTWEYTAVADEELAALARELHSTQPGDTLAYCTKWTAFEERFAQILPLLPVYSNVYVDTYRKALQNYDPKAHTTWTQNILGAYLSDPAE